MPMNAIHRRLCRSDNWAHRAQFQLLPWALQAVPLDGDVLEIGPGYGVTTRWLAQRAGRLTAIEIDSTLAADLRAELAGQVDVQHGDGAALPFADASFDTVVCVTMLHHMSSAQQQDRLFAGVARVLRPGGMFAGSDSRLSLRFRILHIETPWSSSTRARCPIGCAAQDSPTRRWSSATARCGSRQPVADPVGCQP
jgi:SAM-dependent methyltransferase